MCFNLFYAGKPKTATRVGQQKPKHEKIINYRCIWSINAFFNGI
jgi:hypothetical protein